MKIAVVTCYDANFQAITDIVMPKWEAYCAKHGYDFIQKTCWEGGRHAVWAKIWAIHQELRSYDYVLSIDADTLVTNPEVSIELFLCAYPERELWVTHDTNGLNSGVFIVKNTDFTWKLFQDIWHHHNFINAPLGEQIAMRERIEGLSTEDKEKVKIVPQKQLNAYKYENYSKCFPDGQWEKDCFLLHLPGMNNVERVKIFGEMTK